MNWIGIVKFGASAVIGSGFTAISGKVLGPTINNLHGYQKVAATIASYAVVGYLTEKTSEYVASSIDEFEETWKQIREKRKAEPEKLTEGVEENGSREGHQYPIEQLREQIEAGNI